MNIFVFTHYDLDGVTCFLLTKWLHPDAHIEYKPVAASRFREEFVKWLSQNKLEEYDRVYVLDLDVVENKDILDHPNVFIIDHHSTLLNKEAYKNATVVFKEFSSAAMLSYKIFKQLFDLKLSDAQKQLIVYADDYDSYRNEFPESKILNSVFWGSNRGFETFVETFKDGFNGFSEQHKNIHRLIIKEIKDILQTAVIYGSNKIKMLDDYYKVVAIMAEKHIDTVSEYLLKAYSPDIVIFVNIPQNHVSFRRSKDCEADLAEIAEEYCDGSGHEYASGGVITDKFLEFTKKLKLIV